MQRESSAARVIGILLLLQGVGGAIGNFVLNAPVFAAPGFLVNAAAYPLNVGFSVLAGLGVSAIGLGIAISAYPIIRGGSAAMALWLFGLSVANLAVGAVEQIAMMSLLSLSQAYATAPTPDATLFQALRGVVAAARNWSHYVHLIIGGSTLLVLFGALYRLTLIPRVLAAAGAVAALVQMTAVAMPLFGHRIMFPLLAPLGIVILATAAWLVIRGASRRPGEAVA